MGYDIENVLWTVQKEKAYYNDNVKNIKIKLKIT